MKKMETIKKIILIFFKNKILQTKFDNIRSYFFRYFPESYLINRNVDAIAYKEEDRNRNIGENCCKIYKNIIFENIFYL